MPNPRKELTALLESILEMEANATPGPWRWEGYDLFSENANEIVLDDGSAGGEYPPIIEPGGPDAQLIAALRNIARPLIELALECMEDCNQCGGIGEIKAWNTTLCSFQQIPCPRCTKRYAACCEKLAAMGMLKG